jgi:hypothetical protein
MNTTETRATDCLHDVLCHIRRLAQEPGEQAKEAIYQLADAAHNIPLALAGHHVYQKDLEEDLVRLKDLVHKNFAKPVYGETAPKLSWWKRLTA